VKHPDPKPDSLIEALARRAREQDRMADPRWDALPAGELSAEAAEELRRIAEEGEAPEDAYAMLTPFDESERDALADGVFAALEKKREPAAKGAPAGPPSSKVPVTPDGPPTKVPVTPAGPPSSKVPVTPDGPPSAKPPVERPPAPVIPFPKRTRTLLYAATAALSLAAGAALWLRLQGSGVEGIPAYTAQVEGGRSDQRAFPGPSAEPSGHAPAHSPARPPARLPEGGRIDIVLRPATTATGDLRVYAFLADARGVRPWRAPVEPKPNGSFRVAGIERPMLPEPSGAAVELVFVIGRPEALPSEEEMARRIAAHTPMDARGAAQVVTVPLALDETR